MLNDILNESIGDWSQRWVHYSRVPMLKFHTKQSHSDPAGLYFFPEDFEPVNSYTNMPYRFVATLKPTARVLDLSTITLEELEEIIKASGAYDRYKAYVDQYPPTDMHKRVDMAWERLNAFYAYENGNGKRIGEFNKLFRSFGYDAIFDDTKSIHVSEVQLIVLDPRCINIIDMEMARGSGFKEVNTITDEVVKLAKNYGEVSVDKTRKTKKRWSSAYSIRSTITVQRDVYYITIVVQTSEIDPTNPRRICGLGPNDKMPPTNPTPSLVSASIQYASPSLGAGYGSRPYSISKGKYIDLFRDEHGLHGIKQALDLWTNKIEEMER